MEPDHGAWAADVWTNDLEGHRTEVAVQLVFVWGAGIWTYGDFWNSMAVPSAWPSLTRLPEQN